MRNLVGPLHAGLPNATGSMLQTTNNFDGATPARARAAVSRAGGGKAHATTTAVESALERNRGFSAGRERRLGVAKEPRPKWQRGSSWTGHVPGCRAAGQV